AVPDLDIDALYNLYGTEVLPNVDDLYRRHELSSSYLRFASPDPLPRASSRPDGGEPGAATSANTARATPSPPSDAVMARAALRTSIATSSTCRGASTAIGRTIETPMAPMAVPSRPSTGAATQ